MRSIQRSSRKGNNGWRNFQRRSKLLNSMNENEKIDCLVVTGATATGKTALAVCLALYLKGEIISADSRQVYKNLDIGSGKDRSEYVKNGEEVAVHLIDILDIREKEYSVFNFQQDAYGIIRELKRKNTLPIITGGSGMYIDSLVRSYSFPPRNGKRSVAYEKPLKLNPLIVALTLPKDEEWDAIKKRLDTRLQSGMIEEVEGLLKKGVTKSRLLRLGLEYAFITRYLSGDFSSYSEFTEKLFIAIRQFAKRQETWFRHMEKFNVKIHYLYARSGDLLQKVLSLWFEKTKGKE